jgi:hypothetical protein
VEVIGSDLAQGHERTLALEHGPHRLYARDRSQPAGHRRDQREQGDPDAITPSPYPPHRAGQIDLRPQILGCGFDTLRLR